MTDLSIKLGGFIAFALLCTVAIWQESPDIENGVINRATAGLNTAGIRYESIDAGGRIAKIVLPPGSLVSDSEIDNAIMVGFTKDVLRADVTRVAAAVPVPTTTTTTAPTTTTAAPVIEPVRPAELQIDVGAGVVLSLIGRVGSPADSSALAKLVGPPSGWDLIEDAATIAVPRAVLDLIGTATADLTEGHISYSDGELFVTGISTGTEASARFDALSKQIVRDFTATYEIAAPPSAIEEVVEEVIEFESIGFEAGTANIDDQGLVVLDGIAARLIGDPRLLITISGHTDSFGDPEQNLRLSVSRAEAVAAYLVELGVAEDSLTTEGFGDTQPIADNSTEDGRAMNRRIEFTVALEGLGTP